MAVIAAIDIGAILVGGTVTGAMSVIGLPYCLHRTFFKIYGFGGACRFQISVKKQQQHIFACVLVSWSSYVAACIVLALSRCSQMHSTEMAQRL
jgi:hypothetical protein